MPHDIIDNQGDNTVVAALKRILPSCERGRFAAGYFYYVSGADAIADVLCGLDDVRLLIGRATDCQTLDQLAEGYCRLEQMRGRLEAQRYPKAAERREKLADAAAKVGRVVAMMDQTAADAETVSTLVRLIEQGKLKVRVYTDGSLHAKAYILDYKPDRRMDALGVAIVGSSNFTLSGLRDNTERVNVHVRGRHNHAELVAWFDRLWEHGRDFSRELVDELRQAWPLANVTPYQIYLKTLYELTKDHLAEEADLTPRIVCGEGLVG